MLRIRSSRLQSGRLHTLMLLLCLMLGSCAKTAPESSIQQLQLPNTSEQLFSSKSAIPTVVDFYQLTPAQQQQFLQFFNSPAQADLLPHQRLFRYMEQHLVNFNYEGNNTLASATMKKMSGNCISLALLVTALAQLVDIEVGYRASYAEPMLDFSSNIMLSSAHVRSYLFEKDPPIKPSVMYLQRSAIAVDYFKGKLDRLGAMLSKNEFEAMIYNNLAVDALISGDLHQAYWLSKAALQQDADYSPSINLIAIIYRRSGDLVASQQWYEFGRRHARQPVNLISNYLVLAEQLKDQSLITQLKTQLKTVNDDNPYAWFYLALQAEQNKQADEAIYYYQKLLEVAPYMHKANLALAKLQFQLGNYRSARRALHQALEYTYDQDNRMMYQAKLQALNKMPVD